MLINFVDFLVVTRSHTINKTEVDILRAPAYLYTELYYILWFLGCKPHPIQVVMQYLH